MGLGKKRSGKVGVGAITTNKRKLFAEGGMMDDGNDVDPVSGNDVPVGSLAEEVRDDVDAKLSPGEFVFPADVVRFIGLERLMQMRDEAKKGLSRMSDIGQMGNAQEVGGAANSSYDEDEDFESEIDGIIRGIDSNNSDDVDSQTKRAFNVGGFVNESYYDLTKAPKNPALDIRYFNDSQGKTFYMPFVNGKPMKPMPHGATPTNTPVSTPSPTPSPAPSDTGTVVGGSSATGGSGSVPLVSSTPAKSTASDPTREGAGTSVSISGTYTGSNLSDFGRDDMIYNPGGSGPAGEVVTEDLWKGNITKAQTNLGSAVISTLAAAAGVPGIITMGLRAAINAYGADNVNKFMGQLNQEMVGKAGGLDVSTTEGRAGAMSQIDQIVDREGQPAASSGATGTGGRAADAGAFVAESLKDSGLSPEQIAKAAQSAVDAVIRGTKMSDAVSKAITDAQSESGYVTNDTTSDARQFDISTTPEAFQWTAPAPMAPLESVGTLDLSGTLEAIRNIPILDINDYSSLKDFSSEIGFDWGSMGDFEMVGSSGGFGKDDNRFDVNPT